tara:strand:- start:5453 stop:5911 length:459 start_codon:yes stop_codon:yes gene_type:complete
MNTTLLKKQLYEACVQFVTSRLKTIQDTIQSNQEALDSESKSSAGDKHETGRAMLQLEMEKAGQQLQEVQIMKLIVEKIDFNSNSKVGSLGAVIRADGANYFLGISVGKVQIEKESFFVVSPSSPIGKLLLGKVQNDTFLFQGRQTKVLEIF